MPIKGLEKGDGVWGRGKEPFLKKVFPSSPRLPYQPLSGTKQKIKREFSIFLKQNVGIFPGNKKLSGKIIASPAIS